MILKLTRVTNRCYHYVKSERIDGVHSALLGNADRIYGDVTGLRGDVTGLYGNVDDCELSEDDRRTGVSVDLLILNN